MTRSFTAVTFLLGLITYGVCWVACWEYPGAVMVNLPASSAGRYDFASDRTANDPWLQPPPGWGPPNDSSPGLPGPR